MDPAVAHGRRRLVFVQGSGTSDIWRASGGSLERHQVSSSRNELQVDVSPDGTQLAFVSNRAGQYDVWRAAFDGSNPTQMTFIGGVQQPRWSPDGRSIVFSRSGTASRDLWLVSAAGSEARQITTDPAEETDPEFSADGQTIYFSSNRSGRFELFAMGATGGQATQLTRDGGERPIVTPDGAGLVFQKREAGSEVDRALWYLPQAGAPRPLNLRIYVNAFDVAGDEVFAAPFRGLQGPWDGTMSAYNLHTGKTRSVQKLRAGQSTPVFAIAPDGKTMLFELAEQSGTDLMLVEPFR